MKSKDWLNRQKRDFYVKKAKKQGYLSRAAYKLIEIDNKYKICLLYTSPSPRDQRGSRMPSSA